MEKESQDGRAPQPWGWFFVSRVLVFMAAPAISGDVETYFHAVARCAARGTPYGGEEGFGYPALAFLFVSLPWLVGGTKVDLYFPLYRAQCFAVDALLFHLLSRRCSRASLQVYIACTTLLGPLLYHRLDILLGLLLVVVLLLEARGSMGLASLALGASIAFKVIPVLLLPAWLMWTVRRSAKAALSAVCLVALGAGVPTVLACVLWGKDALLFMGAHTGRGIQLESTWASLGILLVGLGLPGKTYFAAGSYNLSTPLEGAFTTASHIALCAAALWGGVISARLARGGRPLPLVFASTRGASLLASKVFSPQFLLFHLPALVWSLDSMAPSVRRLAMALTVASSALTTWVYPYHEKDLEALAGVATVPLGLRNALFALLVVLLGVHAWRSGKRGGGTGASPPG
jgi:hypothetical protein